MTLGRKMARQTVAMIIGLLMIGAASLWGITGLSTDYGVAMEAYRELRHVYDIGAYMETARTFLTAPDPPPGRGDDRREKAGIALLGATREFGAYTGRELFGRPGGIARRPDSPSAKNDPYAVDPHAAQKAVIKDRLAEALAQLRDSRVNPSDGGKADDLAAIGRVAAALGDLDAHVRGAIKAHEQAAAARRRTTMVALASLAGATILGAGVLGVLQYRDVVRPLGGLAWAVRRITRGRFGDRVDFGARGKPSRYPAEFVRLADDFNRMAAELDDLYHKLEAKVAAKSKELVRSERLASVGYLAAGVAHEINNPLGIIVGYAECMMMELKERQAAAAKAGYGEAAADPVAEDIARTLQIICDEAFRCKTITHKLLSLAKPGEDSRRHVDLGDVAAGVVSVLGGVRPFRDRRLSVRAESASRDDLVVNAVEAEMKQVVMNLAINALEAIAPEPSPDGPDWTAGSNAAVQGEVRIHVARRDGSVELTVSDTGRGMTAQTLERVFEPFFTEKRGSGTDIGALLPPAAAAEGLERRHGTGLGLSITHAIVEAHGGRITAHSDGLGKGSIFTVRLPAAVPVPLTTQELTSRK